MHGLGVLLWPQEDGDASFTTDALSNKRNKSQKQDSGVILGRPEDQFVLTTG